MDLNNNLNNDQVKITYIISLLLFLIIFFFDEIFRTVLWYIVFIHVLVTS